MDEIHLSAVAYQDNGLWIVQAIEYDIRARATARDEVVGALIQAVHERVELNRHLGRKNLDGIQAAPAKFAEMFRRSASENPPTRADGKVEVAFA